MGKCPTGFKKFIRFGNIEVEKWDLIADCPLLLGFNSHTSFKQVLQGLQKEEQDFGAALSRAAGRDEASVCPQSLFSEALIGAFQLAEQRFDAERHHAELADAAKRLEGTPAYVPGDPFSTVLLFKFAKAVRQLLLGIASAAGAPGIIELPHLWQAQLLRIGADHQISLEVSDRPDTQLRREFIEAVRGIDASRVRLCRPECQRLFWAHRITAKFCSAKCRQKNWRHQNPDSWATIQNRHEQKRAVKRNRITGCAELSDPPLDRPATSLKR